MALDYDALAKRHGFSRGAVEAAARAIAQGRGTQAQFNNPELGGMGQWMPGMVMIGDGFNHALKARVEALCVELAAGIPPGEYMQFGFGSQEPWWPATLGQPTMRGEQNDVRYVYFEALHRLVISRQNTLHFYDTGDHHITGASQQQATSAMMLVFHTDKGLVCEQDLREIQP